jgi:hypothetical protein
MSARVDRAARRGISSSVRTLRFAAPDRGLSRSLLNFEPQPLADHRIMKTGGIKTVIVELCWLVAADRVLGSLANGVHDLT